MKRAPAGPLSSTELARRLGAQTSQVSGWLSGRGLLRADTLRAVAEQTGTSVDWLLFGEGPMFRGESRSTDTLEADVRVRLRREIMARLTAEASARLMPAEIDIDVHALIDALADQHAAAVQRVVEGVLEGSRRVGRGMNLRALALLVQRVDPDSAEAEADLKRAAAELYAEHIAPHADQVGAPVTLRPGAVHRLLNGLPIPQPLGDLQPGGLVPLGQGGYPTPQTQTAGETHE